MDTTVAVQICKEYEFSSVYENIQKLFELAPPPDVKGKTVLVKPNILLPKKPEAAVCTHPVVVGAVVKAFVNAGAAHVLVGESPAVANTTMAAKICGIYNQVIDNGGEWVEFNEETEVSCPEAKLCHTFNFAKHFEKADLVVSVAKLKSHQLMSYTGAMKNLFGLIVGLKKAQQHYRFPDKEDFAKYLTDLNLAAKAEYAIMDGIVGMDGPGGPGNGRPIPVGFLASSTNILALDCVCSSAAGYNPLEVPNLRDALERNVWLKSTDEIKMSGCTAEEIFCKDFKAVHEKFAAKTLGKMIPPFINSLAKIILVRNPHFNNKKCIRCGKCVQICPAKVLDFSVNKNNPDKKQVVINRKNCIHCYCCHEVCPVEAISLRHF